MARPRTWGGAACQGWQRARSQKTLLDDGREDAGRERREACRRSRAACECPPALQQGTVAEADHRGGRGETILESGLSERKAAGGCAEAGEA